MGMDATMVNTVLEVALPGFLKLDYATDLRPEARLTAGGAGTIWRATLLDNQVAVRAGERNVAMKQVAGWPNLGKEENEDRFHQEVAIMWSLSFHPNIIKLIGYTNDPNTIITPLYKTDLFRFLHGQPDKSQLDSDLMLHLASGMIAGLDAIHSMGVAHRDIKSPNVLLAEPNVGIYPNPLICDFGLSRTAEDAAAIKKAAVINGFSPRYAPPEVFARVHLKSSVTTVDDDKRSDVYSMGVTFWEVFIRRIPWDGVSNDQIEMTIRSGGRLEQLVPNQNDEVQVLLVGVIDSCLQQSAARRPLASSINSKLIDLVLIRSSNVDPTAGLQQVPRSTTTMGRNPQQSRGPNARIPPPPPSLPGPSQANPMLSTNFVDPLADLRRDNDSYYDNPMFTKH
jgi:serine/threonine protein kinase